MVLARWAVPIAGVDPSTVDLDHLHAVTSGWVDDKHWDSPKPWAVRPMRLVDGVVVVEVSALSATTQDRLLSVVSRGSKVRFGRQHGVVVSEPHLLSTSSWDDLVRPTGASSWVVHFLTPTAFGNGSRFTPWPDPFPVGRSLAQRWNAVHPNDPITIDATTWSKIWVSDIQGHSEVLKVAGLTVSGFLGRIRYVCPDQSAAGTFERLLLFAEYAGMGRYTTRGLGAVRVEFSSSTDVRSTP